LIKYFFETITQRQKDDRVHDHPPLYTYLWQLVIARCRILLHLRSLLYYTVYAHFNTNKHYSHFKNSSLTYNYHATMRLNEAAKQTIGFGSVRPCVSTVHSINEDIYSKLL